MSIWDERANLAGKRAVVIGGAAGLGRGITVALAKAGVDIATCDINEAALAETTEVVEAEGRRIFSAVVDVRDGAALDRFWVDVERAFDRTDILVNVVGGVRPKPFLESTPEDWEENIRMNFLHVVQSTQHAARRMQASGRGGSIVNLTTIEAHRAAPRYAVYTGVKAAVTNFARTVAVELGPYGIRINNVAPDTTPTPGMFKGNDPSSYFKTFPRPADRPGMATMEEALRFLAAQAENAIPLQRNGRVEDIENCVLFLASDLSSYITGTTLHPDGGALASSGWLYWPDIGFRNRLPLDHLRID